MTDAPLPSFKNPPLDEVALGFFFDPIPKWETRHFMALRETFKQAFPGWEDHIPVENPIEQFAFPPVRKLRIDVSQKPPLRRQWFVSADQTNLVQLQPDRFVFNWRRVTGHEEYPRFKNLREWFADAEKKWREVLEEQGLKVPSIVQCEVTYVNNVDSERGWRGIEHAHEVLAAINKATFSFLKDGERDTLKWQTSFVIPDDAGEPAGRLYTQAENRFRMKDRASVLRLGMTARGRPLGADLEAAFRFLDKGHEWIVQGFKEVTTPAMHEKWGLES